GSMYKNMVISGAGYALLSVVFVDNCAHTLKSMINTDTLATFEVGVRYQMYHALGLLFIGMSHFLTRSVQKPVFILFTLGIFLFSGSIYLLSLNALLPFNAQVIGFVTPIGGACFIIGWLYFLLKIFKLKSI
ncbi:MAG: DUF423 domain-containing protein, partial [Flavobacteriaceae bacterium]|nr:DUF423 domain-containing protein [Flavobacteriaceae bacterium]